MPCTVFESLSSCILSLSHAKPFILILLSRQSCMKHWCNQYYCSSTCTIYACENLTSCSSSMHCTIRIINQVKAAFRSRDEWWKKASADKKTTWADVFTSLFPLPYKSFYCHSSCLAISSCKLQGYIFRPVVLLLASTDDAHQVISQHVD